jgi:polyisoprenoid-binding protein YceI
MPRSTTLAIPFLAFGLIAAGAQPLNNLTLQPESRIWVKGSSTVRDYTCNAKTIDAAISTKPAEGAALPLEQLVENGRVSVAVAALECGNDKMNEHMRKALKSTDNPQLLFELTSYTIGTANAVTLYGKLTLAGRALPIEITGTIAEPEGGLIRVNATKQIKMTEWGIKPPTLMLGTLKVHDPVTIGLDILLKR